MSDILVVKTAGLAPWIENRYGLITGCGDEILDFVEREHEFLPRPDMELGPVVQADNPLCRRHARRRDICHAQA